MVRLVPSGREALEIAPTFLPVLHLWRQHTDVVLLDAIDYGDQFLLALGGGAHLRKCTDGLPPARY